MKLSALFLIIPLSASAEPMLTAWQDKDIDYAKSKKTAELVYLDVLAWHEGLPDGSLPAMWAVESHAGDQNKCNKFDRCGHFQFGEYEAKKYIKSEDGGTGDKFDLSDAANGAVALARDYAKQAGVEIQTVTDMYILHQQGGGGAKAIHNAMEGGKLKRRIRINICHNLPPSQRKRLFTSHCNPKVDDQTIAMTFYYLWDTEMQRLSNGLVDDDPTAWAVSDTVP